MSCDKRLAEFLKSKGFKVVTGVILILIIAGFAGVWLAASKEAVPVAAWGQEMFCNGILGMYYNKSEPVDDGDIKMIRIDEKIAFDWKLDSPDSLIGKDNFSVVWSGFVTAPESDDYIFRVYSDDGVRLYVNSVELIDRWEPVNLEMIVAKDKIYLKKGEFYSFRLEYKEHYINSTVYLFWESDAVELSVVPESFFYVKKEVYDTYKKPVHIK